MPTLALEKPLYAREYSDGLYKPITYLLHKFFDEIFITVFSSLLFSVFVFFMVELNGSFLLFWLVNLCTLSIGIALAFLASILAPSMEVANAALPAYVVTLLFFGGYLFRFEDIPLWWRWCAPASPFLDAVPTCGIYACPQQHPPSLLGSARAYAFLAR